MLLLVSLLVAVGCRGRDDSVQLGGETNWLRSCGEDAECELGSCVCGVCSAPCGEASSCGDGPPESACFAPGSIGHAALCAERRAPGICLPRCGAASECAAGLACVAGGCVPEAALATFEGSGVGTPAGASAGLELFASDWWSPNPVPDSAPVEQICPASDPCPTLEQLMLSSHCVELQFGCGLISAIDRGLFSTGMGAGDQFWYAELGAPPVGAYRQSGFFTRVPLECATVDASCNSCRSDLGCAALQDVFPEPPLASAPDGCSCAADADGGASVSLECFCSIYGCPARAEAAPACLSSTADASFAGVDGCGQSWFTTDAFRGERYVFSATGELVFAEAVSPGPLTAPCNTPRVTAGAPVECGQGDVCACAAGTPALGASCAEVDWFSRF